jgi:PAS domain S-box-containing protein
MAEAVTCPTCGQVVAAGADPAAHAAHAPGAAERAGTDRDRAAESRDRAAERRDRGADDRDARARLQQLSAIGRDQTASELDQVSSGHDETASGSDQETADADQRVADEAFLAGGDAATYNRGVLARELSRRQRYSASVSRDESTAARGQGHHATPTQRDGILLQAEHDRAEAADDREESAIDREEALRNRTDSAAAAQRALETLEAMSDGFFTLDPLGRVTYLNTRSERFFGRRSEEVLGEIVWEAFPEIAGTRFADEYRRALRDRVAVRFEATYPPLGRTFEARVYPVSDGLAVYFTDVTDERARDERLRQAQRLEAIGRVTATVSHDFNNLLTAIGGFASLGQDTAGDALTRNCLDQIESASQRASALTRQLLVFSREQDLSPTTVDLNEVVSELAPLLGQLLPADVDLRLALSPSPVAVFVDHSQLEQVVVNLVVNSRDAISTAGTILVSTTTGAPAGLVHDVRGDAGWLVVTDTGSGIAADVLPLIFDPFFSTKPRETGAGLGLATIYGIVSQSGGSIIVDSTLGVGTTMAVALPADS